MCLRRVDADPPDPVDRNPDHMKDDLAAGFARLPNPRQRRQIRQLWECRRKASVVPVSRRLSADRQCELLCELIALIGLAYDVQIIG